MCNSKPRPSIKSAFHINLLPTYFFVVSLVEEGTVKAKEKGRNISPPRNHNKIFSLHFFACEHLLFEGKHTIA